MSDRCTWTYYEDYDEWASSCGQSFSIIDSTPKKNQMAFCCYCGCLLVEAIAPLEDDDDGTGMSADEKGWLG